MCVTKVYTKSTAKRTTYEMRMNEHVAYVQSVLLKRYEYSYALLNNSISASRLRIDFTLRFDDPRLANLFFLSNVPFYDYEAIIKR